MGLTRHDMYNQPETGQQLGQCLGVLKGARGCSGIQMILDDTARHFTINHEMGQQPGESLGMELGRCPGVCRALSKAGARNLTINQKTWVMSWKETWSVTWTTRQESLQSTKL